MALIYQPSKRIFCGWFEPLKSTTYSEYPIILFIFVVIVWEFTCDVRDSDLHVIERSLWRAGHMSGLHLQLDETRVSSYFQSIKPAHSAHARTCSLQRSITALLASKKSER